MCRSCTKGHCRSLSTPGSEIEIECPECDGGGCDECNEGQFEIEGCPNAFCRQVVPSIDLIDLFGKGLPPVAGGVLDQSVSFIEAARVFENEEVKVRNESVSRHPD